MAAKHLILGLITSLALSFLSRANENDKPNVLFIFADDLGYGDLSCYGAEKVKTPNIDRLADEGILFTDAHSAASLCSPSRYGLLTGKAPWRLGKKGNGYRVSPDDFNLGMLFDSQGYETAAIGKWHLGYGKDWNKPPISGPLDVGFDYHFGVPTNHNDKYRCFIENGDIYGRKEGEDYRLVKGQQMPEGLAKPRVEDQVDTTLTKKAVEFIEKNHDSPFFLYFAPCCPHTHVTPAEKFRGTSQIGLLGDYIQELDHHVGTLIATLEKHNLRKNTLIIFTSDNGGSPKDFRGTDGTKLNLASTSGDILNKYKTAKIDARKMGHITNGVFKDGKGYPFEGGHRIPFIAAWPDRITPGTISKVPFSLTVILATAADLTKTELPTNAGEDSFSILPVLLGQSETGAREHLFIQGDGKDNAIAVCSGRWKLIAWKRGLDHKSEPVNQLFDLENDPGEKIDVAKKNPEIVARMSIALQKARENERTRPL